MQEGNKEEMIKRPYNAQILKALLLPLGLHSQPLKVFDENLKAHIICENHIRPSSHFMGIIVCG